MKIQEQDLRRISQFKLFEGLTESELSNLLSEGSVVSKSHRGVLFEMGQIASSFAIVLEGAFKLVKPTSSGDDFIIYFATSGDAIGALVMGQGEGMVYPIGVKSIGASRVCVIPKSTFHHYWKSNSQILLRLNSLLYSRMGFLQDEKTMMRAPLSHRISWFLLKMLERNSGVGISGDYTLPLPLTRQEIADHLGATVESVIRIMSQWSQEGIIKSADKHIEVSRVDYLVELLKELA